ncbi:MAG: ankyrin repeat domain-containing protein [Gammaproteobacteria bacterium]|nr:MAG: ankyrin repeat domain-containing protein [Gammaproteobacteria bacterium]
MGTKNIIDAIKKNDPIKLQKALDFFKVSTKEDYDLNQVVQKNGQRLLHIAIMYGSETALLYLLLEPYVNINITDNDGNTPAHYAVIYEQPKILEFLKNNGADFSKKNNYGCTLKCYIPIKPKKEENKRIKKQLESILMDTSNLTMLADISLKPTEFPLKKEMEPKKIYFNQTQATNNSSFFHNLPREFEYQTEPLDLAKYDKPLNLSITSCFK